MYLTTSVSQNYPSEDNISMPTLFSRTTWRHTSSHSSLAQSDIPDRSAIPGNLLKSYVESNSQWGNRSVPPQRIASQTQTGQLQSAAASPGVLRGDTREMSCPVYSLHKCLKKNKMQAFWISAALLDNIPERVMFQ